MAKPKKKPKFEPKMVKDTVRIPGRTGGYVSNPKFGLGMRDSFTVDQLRRHPMADTGDENEYPPEPESPDLTKGGADEWIVKEANERDELRKRRPLHEELELIELKLRPQQKAELRRRIEGLKRSIHEKAA